jgi:DNA-binding winged helix-turn-helix (wHTH) protein
MRKQKISDKIEEHIMAVRTLELADASISESDNELNSFVLKAMERMDDVQELSNELVAIVNLLIEMDETKSDKEEFFDLVWTRRIMMQADHYGTDCEM